MTLVAGEYYNTSKYCFKVLEVKDSVAIVLVKDKTSPKEKPVKKTLLINSLIWIEKTSKLRGLLDLSFYV
jgi:hypothetical protein